MKLLISAYACEPFKGSEPEVGLQTILAAAEHHDVHVITRANNLASLEAYLADRPNRSRVSVIGIDLSKRAQWIKGRAGRAGFYWYYDRWQRLAGETARRLHEEIEFDLVHHVTLATYWQRAVTSDMGIPSVLGPVGGGATTPWRLLPELGVRGVVTDVFRLLVQRFFEKREAVKRTIEASTVILAQNQETADRIDAPEKTMIAPNGTSAAIDRVIERRTRNEIVVIGRLIPYKAGALAVRAFARIEDPDMHMTFIGDGPERTRLERLTRVLGLTSRIEFTGRLSRQETLDRLAGARALLHPALHDDSPLTVAEALSLGTQVVCLDRGGPPVLCALWPSELSKVIPITTRSATTEDLANAIDLALERAPCKESAQIRPRKTFRDQILDAYRAALDSAR